MHQRGDAKISRRRRSEEGEGECFAPFYLEITAFCVEMLFFWSRNGSRFIWDHPQKNVNFSKIVKILTFFCDTFPDHSRSSRGPIELILSKRQALI